jgi:SAM-dependent methyltransferase
LKDSSIFLFPDKQKVLKEMFRVLKPNGQTALLFFGESTFKEVEEIYERIRNSHADYVLPESLRLIGLEETHELFEKAGFKQKQDKDYFCKLGRRLIERKTLIPNDKNTVREFGSFGKIKSTTGSRISWGGIAQHDDLAMTTLNLSRFYEESEYGDWLYDFLDEMPDSPVKRYMMELLKRTL